MDSAKQITDLKQWLGSGSINIFGLQLSGKDTQAVKLAEILDGVVIGGGDIIRGSQRSDVIEVINQGKLAPTNDFLDMVLPYLSKPEFKNQPLILSSIGRWHGEEDSVLSAAEEAEHPIKAALHIDISEEAVWQRWEIVLENNDRGKRKDDTREGLATRLQEFKDKTIPVLDYYDQKGLLLRINGDQPREKVTEDILSALSEFMGGDS